MGGFERIENRRAALREEIGSARTRLATRCRMVELEAQLAGARHPAARLARHLPWLLPIVGATLAGGRGRGLGGLAGAGPLGGSWVSLLAVLLPMLAKRFRRS